jgi:membrane protein implicated in regulation of membrane protease activity
MKLLDILNSLLGPRDSSEVPIEFIIYFICFLLGLLFTVLSALFGHFFGGGHDGHVDAGHSHSGDAEGGAGGMPGMSFFSPTVLASFLTAFGGFGLIFSQIQSTRSVWVSAPLAVVSGLGIATIVFWLFESFFSKTQCSSESRIATIVGHTAAIITPIPPNGVGEIAYVQNGTRYTAPAREESGLPIASGQNVKVTKVVGTQFYVIQT